MNQEEESICKKNAPKYPLAKYSLILFKQIIIKYASEKHCLLKKYIEVRADNISS
jgi:hypothetical protein